MVEEAESIFRWQVCFLAGRSGHSELRFSRHDLLAGSRYQQIFDSLIFLHFSYAVWDYLWEHLWQLSDNSQSPRPNSIQNYFPTMHCSEWKMIITSIFFPSTTHVVGWLVGENEPLSICSGDHKTNETTFATVHRPFQQQPQTKLSITIFLHQE